MTYTIYDEIQEFCSTLDRKQLLKFKKDIIGLIEYMLGDDEKWEQEKN